MGHHVLVRMDNTTTVVYINRQSGLRSRQLYMLAGKLMLWSWGCLLSLRVTHVPGALNTGTDLLSMGAPVYGEWTLPPESVEQIWARYGQATVDLFALRIPPWDLAVLLEGLKSPPFEPLEGADLKHMLTTHVFLLALRAFGSSVMCSALPGGCKDDFEAQPGFCASGGGLMFSYWSCDLCCFTWRWAVACLMSSTCSAH